MRLLEFTQVPSEHQDEFNCSMALTLYNCVVSDLPSRSQIQNLQYEQLVD